MAPLTMTGSLLVFSQAVYQIILDHKVELGLDEVFWRDQIKIPGGVIVCVEPSRKSREGQGVSRYTMVNFEMVILIYTSNAPVEFVSKQADEVAEDIEELLHRDSEVKDLVIDSLVTSLESGYATRSGTLFRAARLVFTGRIKQNLP